MVWCISARQTIVVWYDSYPSNIVVLYVLFCVLGWAAGANYNAATHVHSVLVATTTSPHNALGEYSMCDDYDSVLSDLEVCMDYVLA